MSEKLKEGDKLELATAAYFQSLGYLVRRGVKLSAAAGEKDVTDADLFAVRFNLPVHEERIVVDCKDRSKSKPFERVLWTLGIAAFTKAHRPIVVTPRPISAAREFASQGSVELLAAEDLPRLTKGGQAYGDADVAIALRVANVSSAKTPQTKELARELVRVRQMLVVGNAVTNLNRLMLMMRRLRSEKAESADADWLRKFVADDAVVMATLMLLRFVDEAKWLPEAEWRQNLSRRLTYGDVPPKKALQLARAALDQAFHDGLPPPEYTEEISALVGQMISNPAVAVWAPVAVDYLRFAVGTKPHIPTVPDDLHAAVLLLAKRTISAIGFGTGATAEAPHAPRTATPVQTSLPMDDDRKGVDRKPNN